MLQSLEDTSYRSEIPANKDYVEENSLMTGRLTPIGGSSSDSDFGRSDHEQFDEKHVLLEEQEKLNASLAALTRHFAHVQLRLQQVVSAPTPEDRENLLVELHEFASTGIPNVMCQPSVCVNEQLVEAEKCREKEFIRELRCQLDELERYAAASGSLDEPPTLVMIEKQRVLIDQLREKLNLRLDDASVSKLSAEELRRLVDQAISQLTQPAKLKENLITQMHTQINDLEKFVDFLKADLPAPVASSSIIRSKPTTVSLASPFPSESHPSSVSQSIKRFVLLTELYTFLLLTCGTRSMRLSSTTNTQRHFGDLRARLEIAIENVLNTVRTAYPFPEENGSNLSLSVRKELVPTLQALIEHGSHETKSLSGFDICGCTRTRLISKVSTKNGTMHAWNLVLKYYEMKQGMEFANSPARKLSQSFALDLIGGRPITMKECLLSTIDAVIKLHDKHSKTMNSCFNSFVCHALNEKKLVSFLRMIFKTHVLIENSYQSWSYTKQTDFHDALHSLDRLTTIDFHLPIDHSIRRFIDCDYLIE